MLLEMLLQAFVTALFLLLLSYVSDIIRTALYARKYLKYMKSKSIFVDHTKTEPADIAVNTIKTPNESMH